MSEPSVVDNNDLPLVLFIEDIASDVLRCSVRTLERLRRAKQLPEPLPIPGRPRWARQVILDWVSSGSLRRRGR